MNDLTKQLLRTLYRAEEEHEDNYVHANVQQSFIELLELEGLSNEWRVMFYRTQPADGEDWMDDRVICFERHEQLDELHGGFLHVDQLWVHQEASDDARMTPLEFRDDEALNSDELNLENAGA